MKAMRIKQLLQKANQHFRQGDKKRAARLLRQVIALDPNQAIAWYGLAMCVSDPEQKRVYLERALEIEPDFAEARAKLERLKRPKRSRHSAKQPARQSSGWVWGVAWIFVLLLALTVAFFSWDTYQTLQINRLHATQTVQMQELAQHATQTAQYRAATATAQACVQQFYDDMLHLLSRFFRQQAIAERTPRINLAEQIARLEDIRNEAWNIPTKECRPRLHARLMDYMDTTIAAYNEFLGDNDLESMAILLESWKALAALDDEVIRDGHPGGLLPLFRAKGYFYWEKLEDPHWKDELHEQ